jgi:hypothetical protein
LFVELDTVACQHRPTENQMGVKPRQGLRHGSVLS